MKIGILAFSDPQFAKYAFVEEIAATIEAKGHVPVRLYTPQLAFIRTDGKLVITHNGEPLEKIDVIIARPNFLEDPSSHAYPAQLLEQAGYRIINSWPSYWYAKNKLEQHVTSLTNGLPMARWAIAKRTSEIMLAADKIGFPVVLKVSFGSFGRGVFYADSKEVLRPVADYLTSRNAMPIIVEEFLADADRKDIRVFVVDGKVIASMERTAPPGDIRTNTSNGGSGATYQLSDRERDLALKAAKEYQLEIGGIDLMYTKEGPVVVEVNANPGFEELQKTTNVSIAGAIVDYAIKVATK
ncbi:MAG: Alpha-L-glutamate ligase, RimK family [Candidatus Uhrbacteria bacterium GW2011_GWE2_40_58]|nr:MAG: Alpha-L-glutamate ligase, RimK family [Candidatus Uhrbacteria bacterium GW2011_GWF2_40_263]KKR67952.1 MAG: Alpha-L-glutamate ligase, RimK family [Candidatus Uhrbacteria bacterium GW2011_GWE2_40_58]OGL92399.1 MAG: hypothetical protein A2239_02120 [Candidatus Uhrbacteria bacterium RIFOXYA2_FULL_40_9]OGL96990.1 MAG: hypothetical protein A2332_03925 [Candidatus Uhrbacteria bacterium RIFOXYB2_FULL_41_18]HBK34773.1 hypothetical protein [Candidatus Uhrbacteria bacterium]